MNQPGPSSASSNEEQWQCLKFYHVHSVVKFLGCTTLAVSIVAFVMLCYIAFSPEASQSSVAKSKFEVYQDFDDVFYRMRNEWHFSRFFKGMFSKKTGGSKKKAINLVVGWKILMGMSKTLEGIAEGRVEGSNNRFSRRFNDADRAKLFAAVIRKHVRSVGDERSADFLRSLSDKLERIAMARRVNEADLLDSIASLQALDGFWRTFEEPKELKNLQQWTLKLIAHLQDILKEYEDGMRGGVSGHPHLIGGLNVVWREGDVSITKMGRDLLFPPLATHRPRAAALAVCVSSYHPSCHVPHSPSPYA